MDNRLAALKVWVGDTLGMRPENLRPASADASFRRYFRFEYEQQSYVVMDAPPQQEPLLQFIAIDRALIAQGVHAPQIYQCDERQGFLLLEDLGEQLYLDHLATDSQSLYQDALEALLRIQAGTFADNELVLPLYDTVLLDQELELFKEWFVERHLQQAMNNRQQQLWVETKQSLISSCLEQPQVWVHRDFHSRNLMLTEQNSPGVIDFQDMVLGPIAYDLASIFKDCYLRWPRATQLDWLRVYHAKAAATQPSTKFEFDDLLRWFDVTALQRHLKVLGIFCRLNYRDSKSRYLQDLPLVSAYVSEALGLYPEFSNFHIYFNDLIEKPIA